MKRNRLISAVCVLSLALSLCAGGCSEKKEEATSDIKTETQKVKKAEKEDINSVHLRDKDTLYADDDETSVVTMYLTVSRGNASAYPTFPLVGPFSSPTCKSPAT